MKIEQVKLDALIPWQKIVECPECHAERTVRKDSRSVICKPCSTRKANASALVVIRAKTKHNPCKVCEAKIPVRLGWTYCSVACRVADKKTQRDCKCCGVTFSIYLSALIGKTNASGNFCILNPAARERLTMPILPFSKIEEMGAGMYKGKKITRVKQAMTGVQPEQRRSDTDPPAPFTSNIIPSKQIVNTLIQMEKAA